MRIVLDTNVLISACLKPAGLEAQVVATFLAGRTAIFVSEEIRAEYKEVFCRAKFATLRGESSNLLIQLDRLALTIVPDQRVSAATDEDDNRFLECAQAARADYLVTGNLRHYPAEWAAVKIVNARRFLELTGCIIKE